MPGNTTYLNKNKETHATQCNEASARACSTLGRSSLARPLRLAAPVCSLVIPTLTRGESSSPVCVPSSPPPVKWTFLVCEITPALQSTFAARIVSRWAYARAAALGDVFSCPRKAKSRPIRHDTTRHGAQCNGAHSTTPPDESDSARLPPRTA